MHVQEEVVTELLTHTDCMMFIVYTCL